jgi:hypothetical protein
MTSHTDPASTSPAERRADPADASSKPTTHRRKAIAALLAMLTGWAGLHRLYLRSSLWWIQPMIALPALGWALRAEPWFRQPGFFIFAVVVVISLAEAIIMALTSDERWDARHNPDSGQRSANGWAPVLIAIGSLILAAMLGMTVMAIALEGFFLARRG